MSTDANAYSTAVADAIAPAGYNAFTAYFSRITKPSYAVSSQKKRGPRADGPLTPEQAREARNTNAREWDARRRLKAKAERVNSETYWAAPSGEALHRKDIRIELTRAAT